MMTYAQLNRLTESAARKTALHAALVAETETLVDGELECAYNDMTLTNAKLAAAEAEILRIYANRKHVVINHNSRMGGIATQVKAGECIDRDGQVIVITGVEVVSSKTVRILGRYLDNGAAYSESKRTSTYMITYSRRNVRFAV